MKFPQIKLSTLIVLNLLAAGFLWLNVKEAVLGSNQYIAPLGWPNDAVLLYQEKWHAVRAQRGFTPTWGEVLPAQFAGNVVLCLSLLALAFSILERRSLHWNLPATNTRWMLAAVFSIVLALNLVKFSRGVQETSGYGFPFLAYSWDLFLEDMMLGNARAEFSPGWHLPNLLANICVALWLLIATYALCQKLFMKPKKGVPATMPATTESRNVL